LRLCFVESVAIQIVVVACSALAHSPIHNSYTFALTFPRCFVGPVPGGLCEKKFVLNGKTLVLTPLPTRRTQPLKNWLQIMMPISSFVIGGGGELKSNDFGGLLLLPTTFAFRQPFVSEAIKSFFSLAGNPELVLCRIDLLLRSF